MMYYLDAALSFPTIIFSFFVCINLVLWLLTIIGVVGLEVGDVDVDMDIEAGGGDASTAAEALGFLSRFGLSGVPITITFGLIAIIGWGITFFVQLIILNKISIPILYYPLAFLVFVVAVIASVYLTAKICKPLRISLKNQEAISKRHLIGQVATVRSMSVTETFGEAITNDGGAGLILRIRDDQNQNFKYGDKVVLLEFLSDADAYRVISEDEFKGF